MKRYLYWIVYTFYLFVIQQIKVYSKNIKIESSDDIKNFNEISKNEYSNELIMEFTQNYYDMTVLRDTEEHTNNVNTSQDVVIRGISNGTILDYFNENNGNFRIDINDVKGERHITFENLIFKDYNSSGQNTVGVITIINNLSFTNIYIKFYNCTFIENSNNIIQIIMESKKLSILEESPILFENCHF